jgi:hypothetical protein
LGITIFKKPFSFDELLKKPLFPLLSLPSNTSRSNSQSRARQATEPASNNELDMEIQSRKQVEDALRSKTIELKDKAISLEEGNVALKVLPKQRETDKNELEEKVLLNINQLIFPYLEKLKQRKSDAKVEGPYGHPGKET